MAYKFQKGASRMSGSLVQEGRLDVYDHEGNSNFYVTTAGAVSADGAVTAGGNVTAVGSFIIGSADLNEADMEKLDGITNGTAAASKCMVMSAGKAIDSITSLTATDLIGTNVDGILGADTARAATVTTLTANTSVLPDSSGGADLGSTTLEWGDIYIGDDKKLQFGAGQDATIEYDEDGTDELRFAGAAVTFEQNVSFDSNMDLGLTTADTVTIKGNWTAASVTCANLGTVSAATSITTTALLAAANLDIGAYDMRAATLTADGLTSGRVVFAGTAGVLSDDADFSFTTDTLTVTKLGAYEQAGSVDFSDEAMTNVNIDSGAIDATIIGGSTPAASQFTTISGSGALQVGSLSWYSGDLKPTIDSTTNLGSSALRFSTIYVDNIVGADVKKDVESVAGGGTIAAGTDFALITSANGATVTMSAASAGKTVVVKLSGGVGNLILAATGNDTIEAATSILLESTGSAVTLVALDGTAWFVV